MKLTKELVTKMNEEISADNFEEDIKRFDIQKISEYEPLVEVWKSDGCLDYLVFTDEEGDWFIWMNEKAFVNYCQQELERSHDCYFEGRILSIDQLKECIKAVYNLDYDGPEWNYTTNSLA